MPKQSLYSTPNRLIGTAVYVLLAISGIRAVFWVPEHIYSQGQIELLIGFGLLMIFSSLACLYAYISYRWRWEYVSVWLVVVGLSGYTLISAATEPPQAITEFVSILAAALCLCLVSRGVSLLSFAQKTKSLKG